MNAAPAERSGDVGVRDDCPFHSAHTHFPDPSRNLLSPPLFAPASPLQDYGQHWA